MSKTVENCGNCAFWIYGQCRRRAPGGPFPWIAEHGTTMVDVWPHTNMNDFCGDFELKDAQ